jgi:predicted dehydrogenase
MGARKLQVGLIGTGWIGQHHGRNLLASGRAELAAVFNPDHEKARAFLQACGAAARVHRSWQELLEQTDLEAVVIASPNAAHAEQAIAAAKAGKHIYLEKPMAISLEDCRRIVEAVRESGVKLDMGYHRRLNPIAVFARQLIADGRLGELVYVESDYFHHVPGDSPEPRSTAGRATTSTCCATSAARWPKSAAFGTSRCRARSRWRPRTWRCSTCVSTAARWAGWDCSWGRSCLFASA